MTHSLNQETAPLVDTSYFVTQFERCVPYIDRHVIGPYRLYSVCTWESIVNVYKVYRQPGAMTQGYLSM